LSPKAVSSRANVTKLFGVTYANICINSEYFDRIYAIIAVNYGMESFIISEKFARARGGGKPSIF
jgi:hypothetical protein